jgi:hypothetical protein
MESNLREGIQECVDSFVRLEATDEEDAPGDFDLPLTRSLNRLPINAIRNYSNIASAKRARDIGERPTDRGHSTRRANNDPLQKASVRRLECEYPLRRGTDKATEVQREASECLKDRVDDLRLKSPYDEWREEGVEPLVD